MAGLPSEVEDVVHPCDEVVDNAYIPHVGAMNRHSIFDSSQVEEVTALTRHECIEDFDFHLIECGELAREVATNKSQATCDEYGAAPVYVGDVGDRHKQFQRGRRNATSRNHSAQKSRVVLAMRRGVKNCDRPCARG